MMHVLFNQLRVTDSSRIVAIWWGGWIVWGGGGYMNAT